MYLDSRQNSNIGIFTIYLKLKVISPLKSNFMNCRDNKYLIVHKVIILSKGTYIKHFIYIIHDPQQESNDDNSPTIISILQ